MYCAYILLAFLSLIYIHMYLTCYKFLRFKLRLYIDHCQLIALLESECVIRVSHFTRKLQLKKQARQTFVLYAHVYGEANNTVH